MSAKKELFLYELRTTRWFLLIGMIWALLVILAQYICMIGFFPAMSGPDEMWMVEQMESGALFGMSLYRTLGFSMLLAPAVLGLMACFQFRDFQSKRKREYMMALPFTQKEKFMMRAGVGYGIVSLVSLVMGTGVMIVRLSFEHDIVKRNMLRPDYAAALSGDTPWHTLRTVFLVWAMLLAVYSVYVLAESVVHVSVLATIMGLGVMAAPAVLYFVVVYNNLSTVTLAGIGVELYEHLSGKFVYCGILGGSALGGFITDNYGANARYPGNWIAIFVLLIAIFLICTALAYLAVRRMDPARMGMVVSQRLARNVLSLGISVCAATCVWGFLFEMTSYHYFDSGLSNAARAEVWGHIALYLALWAASVFGLYLLCRKLLKITH